MTHMPDKRPTDSKVVKSLTKYEEGFNVFLAYARNHPSGIMKPEEVDKLYEALEIARWYAIEAQQRLDQKAAERGDVIVDLATTPEVLQERFERLYHADQRLIEAAREFEDDAADYDEPKESAMMVADAMEKLAHAIRIHSPEEESTMVKWESLVECEHEWEPKEIGLLRVVERCKECGMCRSRTMTQEERARNAGL